MANVIQTEFEILASAERVWEVLTDLDAYRVWNPFVVEAGGEVAEGNWLPMAVRIYGIRLPIRPQVLRVDPARELQWRGEILHPALFAGHRFFRLDSLGPERTRVTHGERFGGLAGPLFPFLPALLRAAFEGMNRGWKARAESVL